MENIIRVFVRLLSLYIVFTIIADLPDRMYLAYIFFSGGIDINTGIISIFSPILYTLVCAVLMWFFAPYFSRQISNSYNNNYNFIPNALLFTAFLIISVKYVLEKIWLLVNNYLNTMSLLRSTATGVINKNYSLMDWLCNSTIATPIVSFIVIAIFFFNYKRIEKILLSYVT